MDSRIVEGGYFFAIGNIKPHKNFQWIVKEARHNPGELFVVAGQIPSYLSSKLEEGLTNVIFLGHISDSYMKFLMKHAKALLYPSLIEGFGIPPLEALSMDTPAIVSDIPVMHEIFGKTVAYIDPNRIYKGLNRLAVKAKRDDRERVLRRYSWEKTAKKWFQLINAHR